MFHGCRSVETPGRGTLGWIVVIGTLNEGSLHAALKQWYGAPGDCYEVEVDGFIVDIARRSEHGEDIVEIQTSSFGAMGTKLDKLLVNHRILLVYPIASTVTLVRPGMANRRSPKRGYLYDLFDELVSIPTMLDHPNLALEVVLLNERRLKVHDPLIRRRRGGWRTVDRCLDSIESTHRFDESRDLDCFLADGLPDVFTTADMARTGTYNRATAQKIAYCLRALDRLDVVDRDSAGYHYRRADQGAVGVRQLGDRDSPGVVP